MLTASLVFVVPTVMITVSATRYSSDDLRRDSRTEARRPTPSQRYAGNGLLRRYDGAWHLGSPGFSAQAIQRLGADDRIVVAGFDLRLSLFSGAF